MRKKPNTWSHLRKRFSVVIIVVAVKRCFFLPLHIDGTIVPSEQSDTDKIYGTSFKRNENMMLQSFHKQLLLARICHSGKDLLSSLFLATVHSTRSLSRHSSYVSLYLSLLRFLCFPFSLLQSMDLLRLYRILKTSSIYTFKIRLSIFFLI